MVSGPRKLARRINDRSTASAVSQTSITQSLYKDSLRHTLTMQRGQEMGCPLLHCDYWHLTDTCMNAYYVSKTVPAQTTSSSDDHLVSLANLRLPGKHSSIAGWRVAVPPLNRQQLKDHAAGIQQVSGCRKRPMWEDVHPKQTFCRCIERRVDLNAWPQQFAQPGSCQGEAATISCHHYTKIWPNLSSCSPCFEQLVHLKSSPCIGASQRIIDGMSHFHPLFSIWKLPVPDVAIAQILHQASAMLTCSVQQQADQRCEVGLYDSKIPVFEGKKCMSIKSLWLSGDLVGSHWACIETEQALEVFVFGR
mmetsp:Transcript_57231/g.100202  ORF Transcript_57231/g.100202 Transcript_57231/m.100202 type:complete len:307 (-) Transcript_57231:842-1762(-)